MALWLFVSRSSTKSAEQVAVVVDLCAAVTVPVLADATATVVDASPNHVNYSN